MKISARKTLYHPDDIKSLGYTQPRSRSGPPPSTSLTPSPPYSPSGSLASRKGDTRPSLSSLTPPSGGHARSLSLGSGSLGRSEVRWLNARSKLGRYIEGDDEDYEDVFANPSDSRRCKFGKCKGLLFNHLKSQAPPHPLYNLQLDFRANPGLVACCIFPRRLFTKRS